MIRLWLSRETTVSIHEQLSAQFVLGILSRKLAPGERLPSVRALARRLDLHANTVSAVYQDLAERGWVSRRRGSGVFVRHLEVPKDDGSLETFVRTCIDEGRTRGFSMEDLRCAFGKIAHKSRTQKLLLVDPDPHLARVLAREISESINRTVPFSDCKEASQMLIPTTYLLVTEASATQVPQSLVGVSLRTIRLKSMQDVLAGQQRPTVPVLIAVVSRSESILRWAGTLLSALGFSPDSVLFRNPQRVHWQDGLSMCDIVAADVLAASELPKTISPVIFRIVAEESAAEIRELVTA